MTWTAILAMIIELANFEELVPCDLFNGCAMAVQRSRPITTTRYVER